MSAGRVVVTGACGYIGSVLVPLLQDAPAVDSLVLLDNQSNGSPRHLADCDVGADTLSYIQGDVREYGAVERAVRDADSIIHLAAITGAASTHDRAAETRAVNLEATENVLKAARKCDVERVAFASSCNIYGRAEQQALDETVTPDPINPYAETKYDAEGLLETYREEYGLDTTALRLSTVYGYAPGMRFNLVVNAFVFRALTGRPLTVYGDGSNWRPFIHVADAARAFADVIQRPQRYTQPVYNVGATDANYQIETIAETVRDTLERDLEVVYLEDEQPGPSYHVTFDRLAKTDFELEWTLPDGIVDLATQLRDASPIPTAPNASARGTGDD